MKTIIALLAFAGLSTASAHPSLVAHDHPHGLSALAGLDSLLVAALVVALALAAWKRVRS
jgi:hypothetical protein